jgi:hypothetical protein
MGAAFGERWPVHRRGFYPQPTRFESIDFMPIRSPKPMQMERIAIARPMDKSRSVDPPEPDRARDDEFDRFQQVSFYFRALMFSAG